MQHRLVITLDGSVRSSLQWKAPLEQAKKAQELGKMIMWNLDLGLFSGIQSLHHESEFLSLTLSMSHFTETIWEKYRKATSGLILYKGTGNELPWCDRQVELYQEWLGGRVPTEQTRHLFAFDAIGEYLDALACRLPDALKTYALFDLPLNLDPLIRLQLLNKERFSHLRLTLDDDPNLSRWGILLPQTNVIDLQLWEPLREALKLFEKKQEKPRIIAERALIQEWEGLDILFVATEALSSEGIRALQGFSAAGGRVVPLGPSLNNSSVHEVRHHEVVPLLQ